MAIINAKPTSSAQAYKAMERSLYKIAHSFAKNNRQDFDDIFAEACKGFMLAYNSFDDSKGCAFSSYAYQWAWACAKDYAVKDWTRYANTSAKEIDDTMGDAYDMDIVDDIDMSRKLDKLDATTRDIVVARHEGYTFREIAEGLTELGEPCTLHQVRNRYLAAMS